MNHSLFDLNLTALRIHAPNLAERLMKITFDNFPIELVPTKTSAPSLRILPPISQKSILLHSAYDPLREAERWAESIEIPQPTNVLVLGIGLGYNLLPLLQKHPDKIRFLFLIERDLHILYLALATLDLRKVIAKDGVQWLVGEEAGEIPEIIGEKRTDIIIHNFKILSHEPSLRCFPDYYQQVQESILDALTYDEINLRTTFENRGRNQFNIFMNLPAIYRGYALKDAQNLFAGYPAVVAAAGPSLDKNIRLLHSLRDRAALFIVDTALASFHKQGIVPHFVVTGDPTPLNFSHFETIPSLGETFLAFHPEVNRNITQKYIHHPYLLPMFDQESALLEYLFNAEADYGMVKRAMNVGHLAFNLARYMGCAPILWIGFDMAFPKQGGTTHAQDAALSRRIDPMQSDGTVVIGEKAGKAPSESGKMILVPGYYEEPVPTTIPFSQYIKALERSVAECDFPVIDATEGGAYKKGTQRMPLQEALETVLKSSGVNERLQVFRQKPPAIKLEDLLVRLERGRVALAQGRNLCNTLWAQLLTWKSRLEHEAIRRDEAETLWQEFDKIWIQMVGEPQFDAFLGTSVHYLYFCRQRSVQLPDHSGNTFLRCMIEKYEFIIQEMKPLLDHFIECIDLSKLALQTLSTPESES